MVKTGPGVARARPGSASKQPKMPGRRKAKVPHDWVAVERPASDEPDSGDDADELQSLSGSEFDSQEEGNMANGSGRRRAQLRNAAANGDSASSSGGEEEDGSEDDAGGSGSGDESGSGSEGNVDGGGAGPSGRAANGSHKANGSGGRGGGGGPLPDLPDLLSLLSDMKAALAEVRSRVEPLTAEVRAGQLQTAEGLSYLEAKHLLLVQYCACLVVYVMLRAEGRPVAGHPVVTRLVQLRAYIERARPIDKQLAYQIEKLLRTTEGAAEAAAADAAAAEAALPTTDQLDGPGAFDPALAGPLVPPAAAAGGEDALRYRPNPAALITKAPLGGAAGGGFAGGDDDGAAPAGVYRPPKLNPVAMEEDREASRQERRRAVEVARRAKRSSLVRELAQELAGAPEEVETLLPGLDSAAALATKARLEARAREEEDLMMRVPLSKKETKKLKAQRRAGLAGHGLLDDFADEVADLVGMADGGRGAARKRSGGFAGGGGSDDNGFETGRKPRAPGATPDSDFMAASRAARAAARGGGGKRRR